MDSKILLVLLLAYFLENISAAPGPPETKSIEKSDKGITLETTLIHNSSQKNQNINLEPNQLKAGVEKKKVKTLPTNIQFSPVSPNTQINNKNDGSKNNKLESVNTTPLSMKTDINQQVVKSNKSKTPPLIDASDDENDTMDETGEDETDESLEDNQNKGSSTQKTQLKTNGNTIIKEVQTKIPSIETLKKGTIQQVSNSTKSNISSSNNSQSVIQKTPSKLQAPNTIMKQTLTNKTTLESKNPSPKDVSDGGSNSTGETEESLEDNQNKGSPTEETPLKINVSKKIKEFQTKIPSAKELLKKDINQQAIKFDESKIPPSEVSDYGSDSTSETNESLEDNANLTQESSLKTNVINNYSNEEQTKIPPTKENLKKGDKIKYNDQRMESLVQNSDEFQNSDEDISNSSNQKNYTTYNKSNKTNSEEKPYNQEETQNDQQYINEDYESDNENNEDQRENMRDAYKIMKKILFVLHNYASLVFNWVINKIDDNMYKLDE